MERHVYPQSVVSATTIKNNYGCWSSTKWISSSTHRNITCTLGIKQQPITQFFNLATDLQNRTMNESGSKNLQHNRIKNESESKNYHII